MWTIIISAFVIILYVWSLKSDSPKLNKGISGGFSNISSVNYNNVLPDVDAYMKRRELERRGFEVTKCEYDGFGIFNIEIRNPDISKLTPEERMSMYGVRVWEEDDDTDNNIEDNSMEEQKGEQHIQQQNNNYGNGCVLVNGGTPVIHIHNDSNNNVITEQDVPKELQTDQAQALLIKLQSAGWLDEALQPVGMSRPKMAVLAHSIADELGIKNMWTLFCDLWGVNALSAAYHQGMKQEGMGQFLDEFAEITG